MVVNIFHLFVGQSKVSLIIMQKESFALCLLINVPRAFPRVNFSYVMILA